jgi:regulatory protein
MDLSKAKEFALRLLARREYGAFELKQRLLEKGYQPEVAEQVINELIKLDLQSDQRFVEVYVRWKITKGYGPLYIQDKLIKKLIGRDLIKQYLVTHGDYWQEIVRQVSSKKFGTSRFLEEAKKKASQIQFLLGRGFSLIQIKDALS